MKNELEIFTHKKRLLGELILDGFIAAYYSHKSLFSSIYSECSSNNMSVALAYLTEAHSYFVNAKIYFLENISVLGERDEIEYLIHRFSVYNKEFMQNARTDHSHQWSDIEFHNFVQAFKPAAALLSIDEDEFWIKRALKED